MNTRPWAYIVAFEFAVLALIGLGIVALIRGASAPEASGAMAAGPVVTLDLATVTPAMASDYHYAAEHAAELTQIPCYCGCDRTVGHRNLAECYVTATGAWDAHAAGCAVCGNELATAREQLGVGASIADVRAQIINNFGPPPSLFNTGASS